VALVAPRRVLGGYFRSPNNGQGVLCIDERFFSLRPEITITKDQIAKLRQTRTGAVVSVALKNLYGWKVGDKVPLQTQTLKVDGSSVWTFDIVGIVDDADYPGLAGWFIANYEYLNEARAADKNTIDRFLVRINDPNRATQISRQIDKLFINSAAPTRTTSEKSRSQSDIQFLGDVNLFTHAIVAAVFFMLLFVTGNTMMQSVRERIPEIAVLKTIGFTDNSVLCLVIAEAVLLCLIAATGGLLLSKIAIPLMSRVLQDYVLVFQTSWMDMLRGFGLALIVAVISSLYPAWSSRRLSIVSGLSRH
jgi:putative ABC transport system permease protein